MRYGNWSSLKPRELEPEPNNFITPAPRCPKGWRGFSFSGVLPHILMTTPDPSLLELGRLVRRLGIALQICKVPYSFDILIFNSVVLIGGFFRQPLKIRLLRKT